MRLKIGFLMFEGVEELDLAGPFEVFGTTAAIQPGAAELYCIARSMDPVRGNKGLRMLPDVTFADAPDLDLLIVPGGRGRVDAMKDPAVIRFLRERRPVTERLASVCTGAFLLAEAGLLDGREATTHWRCLDELRGYPAIRVRDARVIDQGDLLTSGGVACGIDLALHVVGQVFGPETAGAVAKRMCYEAPLPPAGDPRSAS
jgi:cyclohexyl-isocyanide hydratase